MSSSVGRNSLIMATGTAASRVTGQLRTILLAAAIGTTGLAANAYQAGSMIPQSVFTLVSGGIFNAVLVPQIVRTLKEKDAQERLNRLITLAIGILLAMTVVMAAASPLLARLYVGSDDHQMIALTTSFTLWCMPQVFFYGLYTVLGQILAAKDHFLTYAWSSTGANIISCAGFTGFILLFSKANEQPLEFWTADKIALTAGTWTLGVAFQALILFLPLARIGFKYKPSFGLGGFGLRSMGPVALGSLGVVLTSEICGIILTRIATSAPQRAHELTGASLFSVAGNATYQNAYTLFILPYSLIAVSVSTAMFPKISRSIAAANLDEARHDLVSALNNVGLLIMFFAAAMVVFPEPIIRALLPSVSMDETMLISYALIALSMGIPLGSAFLLIQRTFYAFEDGLHPFLSAVMQYGFTSIFMIIGMMVLPPEHWVLGIAWLGDPRWITGVAADVDDVAPQVRRQSWRSGDHEDICQGHCGGTGFRSCGLADQTTGSRTARRGYSTSRRAHELVVCAGHLRGAHHCAGRSICGCVVGGTHPGTHQRLSLDTGPSTQDSGQ